MVPIAAPEATIRPAGASDFPAIVALLEDAALPTDGIDGPGTDLLVAELDGRIVGLAGLERYGETALLRSVAVARAARGRGLGALLSTRMLEAAALAGARAVYLLTTTAESCFPRLGFRTVGREAVPAPVRESVEFTTACPSTATAMVLELEGRE